MRLRCTYQECNHKATRTPAATPRNPNPTPMVGAPAAAVEVESEALVEDEVLVGVTVEETPDPVGETKVAVVDETTVGEAKTSVVADEVVGLTTTTEVKER